MVVYFWHVDVCLGYLEQIKSRIENFLNDFLKKLFKDAILIDSSLVYTEVVYELHSNDTFYRIHRQPAELVVSILQTGKSKRHYRL